MKIWRPRRKKKSLLSLFSERVPWAGEEPGTGLVRLPPLDARPTDTHPKNAPGGFYVVNHECMTCGYPHVLAPDLMAWEMNSEGREGHCYFGKQPETPQEIEQAVNAVNGSCCGALRYCGSDPEIIRKLKDAGCKEAIDRQ